MVGISEKNDSQRITFWPDSRMIEYARKKSVYLLLGATLAISGLLKPDFLTANHLLNLLRQTSPLGVVAAGQTVTIIAGSFDLSVGAVIGLVNVLLAEPLFSSQLPAATGIICVLALGAFIGWLNGLGIVKLNISPLIMTMGMMITLEGLSLLVSGGAPGGQVAGLVRSIGAGKIAFMPMAFAFWVVVTAGIFLLLKKTRSGRKIYSVGGNRRAAYMSGINTDRIVTMAHVICGTTAALAGVMLSGYIGTGALGLGADYMMNSIAAVIIGGTRLEGGLGSVFGSATGAFLLVVIISIFSMFNVGYPAKLILGGGVIIAAMTLYKRK